MFRWMVIKACLLSDTSRTYVRMFLLTAVTTVASFDCGHLCDE